MLYSLSSPLAKGSYIDTALNKEQDELNSLSFLNTEPHNIMNWMDIGRLF